MDAQDDKLPPPSFDEFPEWFQQEILENRQRGEDEAFLNDSLRCQRIKRTRIYGCVSMLIVVFLAFGAVPIPMLIVVSVCGSIAGDILARFELSPPAATLVFGSIGLAGILLGDFLAVACGNATSLTIILFVAVLLVAIAGALLGVTTESDRRMMGT